MIIINKKSQKNCHNSNQKHQISSSFEKPAPFSAKIRTKFEPLRYTDTP